MESDLSDIESDLYPLNVLKDELANVDLQARLSSISKISTVALALGTERTRTELLGFLRENVLNDDDEVIVTLAEELANFVPLIGGAEYVQCLTPLLETLASAEEAIVRDKAVEALLSILKDVTDNEIHVFVQLIQNLAKQDWFCARNSATGLFSSVYPRALNSQRPLLREIFSALCEDETPMVRRAAASKLGRWKFNDSSKSDYIKGFAEVMEEEHVSGVLVPLLTRLIQDEQDSVRLLAVQSSIYICRALDNEQRHVTLLPLLLQNCCSDSSWRVRYVLAEKFVELHEASGSAAGVTGFVDALLKLLRDSEAEVRAAAASVISDFCAGLPEDCKTTIIVEQILPCVKSLSMDASPFVRSALALHIMKLSKTIDPELSMSCLVDLFTTFLADDFPDVRLNAILTLSDICGVLSTSSLSRSIIPSIIGLSEDRQWRVRLSVIEYIPELARRLDDEFSENVGSLCTKWLCDSVHFIRKSTSKTIADLVRLYGATWAKTAIFPALFQMANYQNYLHRMTVLFTIDSLLPVLDSDVIIEDLIPLVIKMAGDPIANVRFNAAKTMGSLIKSLSFKPENIEITLKSLEEDPDPDVRFYANQSLECC